MCSYFSKNKDQCLQTMMDVAMYKEAFENSLHHCETMKTISRAYLCKRK